MNRLVVLGASNIARNFCNIARIARQINSGPLDMQLAFGHGRSYELRTTVLVRQLPGINHCGIWSNLENSLAETTYSLVTDIGNDILYGRSIQQIIESVRTSVVRLQAVSQRIVITRPPMHAIRKLDSLRFVTMRSILFPGCRLSLSQTVDLADDLDQQILKLAAEQHLVVLEPLEHWFGLDPIHIQLWHSQAAWQTILNCVFAKDDADAAPVSDGRNHYSFNPQLRLSEWSRLLRARNQVRWLFGQLQQRSQPCVTLRDGSTVSVY